jgi:CRISPR-associated protein Cmr4
MTSSLMFVHAVTPLHAGIGQGTDVIDLPIAREVSTGLPILPGSSIKGALRAATQIAHPTHTRQMFGPDTKDAADHAGAVQCSDAYLLCMPVRSLAGMFGWVASPYTLRRLSRDAIACGLTPPAIPTIKENAIALSASGSALLINTNSVVFEDLDLNVSAESAQAWIDFLAPLLTHIDDRFLAEHFCIVSDDVLNYLSSTATEVRARVRLTEEKTVQPGALWYEESLPCESLLVGLVLISPLANGTVTAADMQTTLESLTSGIVQFGGKSTTGHGYCRVMWA